MDTFAEFGNAFATIIAGGTQLLLPYATAIAYGMLCLAVMLYAISMAFSSSGPVIGAVRLALVSGFWLFCITYAQTIGEGLLGGSVQFGMLAGGHSINADQFLNSPDSIFIMGFARGKALFDMADEVCSAQWLPGSCMNVLGSWLPLVIAGWTVTAAFIILAGSVLATCILFKAFILIAILLIPCAIFDATAWLGMGPVKALAHSLVQILVLAFAVSVGSMVFAKLEVGHVPGLSASLPFVIASIFLCALTLGAQKKAYSLVHGAMLPTGALLGGPARSAAGGSWTAAKNLDNTATSSLKAAGGATYNAISSAVSANARNIDKMTGPQSHWAYKREGLS